MSDPTPTPEGCEPATVYGPCAPYLTVAGAEALLCGLDGLDVGTPEEPGPDRPLFERALAWASRRVFLATGQRFFGCCLSTIRPCRSWCEAPFGVVLPGGFPWNAWPLPELPAGWMSGFVPVWACGCAPGGSCSCSSWDRIPLPLLPVREIVEVKIDGDVLPPTAYAVEAQAYLVRIDGERWPSCQDTTKPDTEPGTWSVSYRHALDLPPEGLPLVGMYAVELAKRCKGGECQLPEGVRVVNRDGVDFAVSEPSEYRDQGLTGFGPVDDWVALLNGGHVSEPPRIYRPGRPSAASLLEA